MKFKITKEYIIIAILVLAVCGISGFFNGRIRGLMEISEQHELRLLAHDKQIPYVTRYMKLVEEMSVVADNKLTAFEITEVCKIIIVECQRNQDIGLTPAIIMAVIERESNFDPTAISEMGAYGLMQCIQATFERHLSNLGYQQATLEVMLDPVINIQVGIKEIIRLKKIWLTEGYETRSDWKITFYSYYAGERWARLILTTLKKETFPGLEYSAGTTQLVNDWKERGV